MYQPFSFFLICLNLIQLSISVDIELTHEVNLLPPYGHGNIVTKCTNIAPGICCLAPRGTGADDVHIQHLTIFDVAALWGSRRRTDWQIYAECSGRVVDSRTGPGDWRWHRWQEGRAYDSPSIHGASYITLPRALPPDGKAKAWMAVEGLLGLAWGSGEWFINEAAKGALAGGGVGSGSGGRRRVRRDLRLAEKGTVYARPPLRAVFPDVVELGGERYVGDREKGVIYTGSAGSSINLTEVFGREG